MLKDPPAPRGKFKSLYYKHNKNAPYTSTQMPEDDYLQTDVWREIRMKRLRLDNYQCQNCGTAKNVEVHHLRYPDVWGTENILYDLITLCDECHETAHVLDIKEMPF